MKESATVKGFRGWMKEKLNIGGELQDNLTAKFAKERKETQRLAIASAHVKEFNR